MKLFDEQMIVVTGGAGFIGSNVVRVLNEKGIRNIVIVDDLRKGDKWMNLVGKSFQDIVSRNNFFEWLKGKENLIEAFIHLGACSSTVETDCDYLLDNNYRFSVKLAEYAFENGQRFIYASSAATYGDGGKGFLDDAPQLESLRPLNMYGYSKHMFDLWLKNQDMLDQAVGLKYFNVFGPNEYHKGRMASSIMHWVPQIKKEGVVRLFQSSEPSAYKDGEQVRDFIYVDDAAKMTAAFLENKKGGLFNIGTGSPTTWNALATAIFEAMDLNPRIDYIPMPEDLKGKYQNYTCADMKRSQDALNYKTQDIPAAVKHYVQHFLLTGKRW